MYNDGNKGERNEGNGRLGDGRGITRSADVIGGRAPQQRRVLAGWSRQTQAIQRTIAIQIRTNLFIWMLDEFAYTILLYNVL